MFDRYVENARRTIFFARYEAAQLGSSEIAPEHILLGLLKDLSLISQLMSDVSETRDEILDHLRHNKQTSSSADIFLNHQSQRVLAAAEEEAERMAHRRVGNHHMLLGVLHVQDSFAAQLLRRNGLSPRYLREQISTLLQEEPALPMIKAAIPDTSPAERKLYELDERVIELFRLNDYEGAMKVVDDAIADPSLNRIQTIQRLVPIASVIAQIIGDLDSVKHYCELRLACDPDDPSALYALANCLAQQGRTNEAKEAARKSYELTLVRGGTGSGLAQLIEKQFPEIKAR